eukprot:m.564885 g.564885  ORF g.564885 m.564885 type:complete len:67 (+) comp57821_c1_seq11:384-584(+)
MIAAYCGFPACVQLLLHFGADSALIDSRGKTAVEVAREKGHQAVVALLEGMLALRGNTRVFPFFLQ